MFPFRNPLTERDRRIEEGNVQLRINGARNLIFNAALAAAEKRLTQAERYYLRCLCGLESGSSSLSPHEKTFVSNLFERTYKKYRKQLNGLPPSAVPGLQAVYDNRKAVREMHKAAGKRKQKPPGMKG